MAGVGRVKWWRYKYMIIALLLINAFAIHYFFVDSSATSLNPFDSRPEAQETVVPPTTGVKDVEVPKKEEVVEEPKEKEEPKKEEAAEGEKQKEEPKGLLSRACFVPRHHC